MKITLLFLFSAICAFSQTAEKAWYELMEPRFRKAPEFSYHPNNPELPNVLIYGDSISIHYHEELREASPR